MLIFHKNYRNNDEFTIVDVAEFRKIHLKKKSEKDFPKYLFFPKSEKFIIILITRSSYQIKIQLVTINHFIFNIKKWISSRKKN